MPSRVNPRNHRNNPYLLDDLFGNFHRSAIGVFWRMRTEMTVTVTTVLAFWLLSWLLAMVWAALILSSTAVAVTATSSTRRFFVRRAWCVISRHRIQRVFFETRMHTRSGRISLILRIHPTEVGERAVIWCRAGICFEDFEAHTGEIAAACYAREARVERSKRWAQLVELHIVRRDTLAAHHVIASALAPDDAEPELQLAPEQGPQQQEAQLPA